MALQFRDSASNYISNASALGITDYGLTFACRFRVLGTQTTYQPLIALNDVADSKIIALMARMDDVGDPLQMQFNDGTLAYTANSVAAIADDTWYTAVGILEADKIHVHLNGVCVTTAISPGSFPAGFDRFSVGAEERFALKISNVDIEDVCVWTVALTEAETQRYAAGVYSREIRNASIVGQWDGRRTSSPIPANVGTYDLTVNGTVPTAGTSPTVVYGRARKIELPEALRAL